MKHLRDIDGVIHCDGAVAAGEFVLCGLSRDGENGDAVMSETKDSIDCNNCIGIIHHCKNVRPAEVVMPFKRRT